MSQSHYSFSHLPYIVKKFQNDNQQYTTTYIRNVLSSMKNTKQCKEMENMITSVIQHDELIKFFKTQDPPVELGYMFWDCPEMTLLKTLIEKEETETTFLNFALICRNLKLFFTSPEKFYNVFEQS